MKILDGCTSGDWAYSFIRSAKTEREAGTVVLLGKEGIVLYANTITPGRFRQHLANYGMEAVSMDAECSSL